MIRCLFLISFLSFFLILGCKGKEEKKELQLGAERTEIYLSKLEGKKVGLLINHTSMVGDEHLVDFLLSKNIEIEKII